MFAKSPSAFAVNPRISPYDIACEPSPSIPAETLLQDGSSAFLLFFAVSKTVSETGYFRDLGVAVVECVDCSATKFGYPNDEGLPEHTLYGYGLGGASSSVLEVADSPWASEVAEQMKQSFARIWRREATPRQLRRHFLICLNERTFECLASELVVRTFAKDFSEAFAFVQARFNEH